MKMLTQSRKGAKDQDGDQLAPLAPLRLGVRKYFPAFDGNLCTVRDAEGLIVCVGTKRDAEDFLDFQENQDRLKGAS